MINDKENVNNLDDLTVCETKFCGIIDQTFLLFSSKFVGLTERVVFQAYGPNH
jgi:hypothetical protein